MWENQAPNFENLSPDSYASAALLPLSRLLRLAADLGSGPLVRRAHARAFPLGLHRHSLISANLISAYSLLGLPSLSRLVFDSLPYNPSTLLWNSLLAAYSRNGRFREPLSLFNQMRTHYSPDNYTLSILSKASGELSDSITGRSIHSLITRLGFGSDTVLSNSLTVMYFRCEYPSDARRMFDEMPVRSVASWNALLSEYAISGDGFSKGEIWKLVRQMQMNGMKPDAFTISTILPLCGVDFGSRLCGREIHCFAIRHDLGLGLDFHVGTCLINMYSECRSVDIGRRVFDRMVSKNVVTWTAMIASYVEDGNFEEALKLFRTMQLTDGIVVNKVTLISILPAIGSLGGLLKGKQIHAFAIKADLNGEVSLNNAMIDMYSKCGSFDSARCIFDDESWHKDAISWSSMISSYGIHGRGEEAVVLFNKMCRLGIKLDRITSVGVLSACGRAGLVAEGLKIYDSLVEDHGVLPTVEICSCMVDMLGRAGQLKQALDFINSMLLTPGPSVWGALFSAALIHNDQEMQDLAYKFLLQSEPENPSNYVSVSNIHASYGRWDFVEEVRTRMKERGLKKMPGYSWISVDSKVHSFCVADKSHRWSETIYALLDNLVLAMKEPGRVPNFDNLT